ncbi:MAG: transposase [Phycisphaeraceae bacterium]
MGRPKRVDVGGGVYHVLNRAVRRRVIFARETDFAGFERVLAEAVQRAGGAVQLLAYCVMGDHWHLVVRLRPGADGALRPFMQWLTLTHTQRHHTAHRRVGEGPLYQGRYKAFLVQKGEPLLTICRYVERNAARAGLVSRAEDWRWSSLWRWRNPGAARVAEADWPAELELSPWPTVSGAAVVSDGSRRPRQWLRQVNTPLGEAELAALRLAGRRGRPYGGAAWVKRMVARHDLASSVRPVGRPRQDGSA